MQPRTKGLKHAILIIADGSCVAGARGPENTGREGSHRTFQRTTNVLGACPDSVKGFSKQVMNGSGAFDTVCAIHRYRGTYLHRAPCRVIPPIIGDFTLQCKSEGMPGIAAMVIYSEGSRRAFIFCVRFDTWKSQCISYLRQGRNMCIDALHCLESIYGLEGTLREIRRTSLAIPRVSCAHSQ